MQQMPNGCSSKQHLMSYEPMLVRYIYICINMKTFRCAQMSMSIFNANKGLYQTSYTFATAAMDLNHLLQNYGHMFFKTNTLLLLQTTIIQVMSFFIWFGSKAVNRCRCL